MLPEHEENVTQYVIQKLQVYDHAVVGCIKGRAWPCCQELCIFARARLKSAAFSGLLGRRF